MGYTTADQIRNILPKLKNWLSERGAQVLTPCDWELLRFKTGDKLAVIYYNKHERLTFTGEALMAVEAFTKAGSYRAAPASKRKNKRGLVPTVRQRDGDLCFYCIKDVAEEDESLEHLVAVTHGGPNHISNLFLAHKKCNEKVGHKSAVEKIAIHVTAIMEGVPDETT